MQTTTTPSVPHTAGARASAYRGGVSNTLTIAWTTAKESLRQPAFVLLLLIGLAALAVNIWVPFFTLGEDIKMYKDCGLATILFVGLLLSLMSSSSSIAEEIEGRTAVTLLSKPITRRQFILGKYFGILAAVLVLFVILSVCFGAAVYYKTFYDAREAAREAPPPAEAWAQVEHVAPGLLLAFFEVATLTAISVAISTRLPMTLNLVICLAIFLVGHLTPVLVQAAPNELVSVVAGVIATVLPSLESFNIEGAIIAERTIEFGYIGVALLYTLAYSGAALLLAFLLFEDRDLA